jgi:hypothetical protein
VIRKCGSCLHNIQQDTDTYGKALVKTLRTNMCSAFAYEIEIKYKTCAFEYIRQFLQSNCVIIRKTDCRGFFFLISSTVKLMSKRKTWRIFENCAFLGYYALGSGSFLQIFRDKLSLQYSSAENHTTTTTTLHPPPKILNCLYPTVLLSKSVCMCH